LIHHHNISKTKIETVAYWQGGAGGPRPPSPQLAILGGRKNEKGAPNFESGWEKTHSKKYSYFRQEKMCLYAYKQTKRIGDKIIH
jgi:hypothetical protein